MKKVRNWRRRVVDYEDVTQSARFVRYRQLDLFLDYYPRSLYAQETPQDEQEGVEKVVLSDCSICSSA